MHHFSDGERISFDGMLFLGNAHFYSTIQESNGERAVNDNNVIYHKNEKKNLFHFNLLIFNHIE